MKKMTDYRTTTGLIILMLCATAEGHEDAPPVFQKLSFDITAPSMVQALIQFTQQSGLQLAFPTKGTDDLPAPQVIGEYTPAAALDQLLKNSGLRYEFANARTVSVRTADTSSSLRAPASSFRLADASTKAESTTESGAGSLSAVPGVLESPSQDLPRKAIPEILVRGEKTLNMDVERTENDAQPYVVFRRDELERSSAPNIESFLKQRLMAETSAFSLSQRNTINGNASQINLRGLGTDETLVLIDGRRVAGYGLSGVPNQPDINGIPLSAVERIEILPTTASGIYGGSATGGVVNIVLKRDFRGADVKVGYGNTFDTGARSRRVDSSFGFGLEQGRTNVLIAASWSDASDLLIKDRDLLQRGFASVLENNPSLLNAAVPPLGAATNIRSTTGGPLTLKNGNALASNITSVPIGYAGPSSDNGAALVANAGSYNLNLANTAQTFGTLNGGAASLLAAPTVKSVQSTVRRDFTSWLNAFLEFSTSENDSAFISNGVSATQTFSLAANAPGNPFQQAITVNTPLYGTDQAVDTSLKSSRAAGGLIASLPRDWMAELDYTWNRTRISNTGVSTFFDTAAASAAISNGTINIFRDNSSAPLDFSSYLGGRSAIDAADSVLKDAALRVGGPLPFALPAGAPVLSALVEHREESIGDYASIFDLGRGTVFTAFFPSSSQHIDSAYLEMRVPIISSQQKITGINLLELQVAARRDRYRTRSATSVSGIGTLNLNSIQRTTNELNSTDPTIAIRYQPIKDLMLRGSYGAGFLPPAVNQLVAGTVTTRTLGNVTDPLRGNEALGQVTIQQGGNPNLGAEQSKSWSAGFVVNPTRFPNFRLSADWTEIEKTNAIVQLFASVPDNFRQLALFAPERVTRAAPAPGDPYGVGRVVAIDETYLNIATAKVKAADLALNYTLHTSVLGTYTFGTRATHLDEDLTQVTPGATAMDTAGVRGEVKWRANASVDWTYSNWSLQWTARYFDSYFLNAAHTVVPNQASATVPSQIYHDLFASYRFAQGERRLAGLLSNTEVQLAVDNVFNTRPPFDTGNTAALYSYLGDPRLTSYFVSIRKSF